MIEFQKPVSQAYISLNFPQLCSMNNLVAGINLLAVWKVLTAANPSHKLTTWLVMCSGSKHIMPRF